MDQYDMVIIDSLYYGWHGKIYDDGDDHDDGKISFFLNPSVSYRQNDELK